MVEHTLAPQLDCELQVSRKFNTLDWGPIINLNGVFYPRLVREFYANIENKEADPYTYIRSVIKGVKIIVSRDTIATSLNIFDNGPIFDMRRDYMFSDNTFSFTLL